MVVRPSVIKFQSYLVKYKVDTFEFWVLSSAQALYWRAYLRTSCDPQTWFDFFCRRFWIYSEVTGTLCSISETLSWVTLPMCVKSYLMHILNHRKSLLHAANSTLFDEYIIIRMLLLVAQNYCTSVVRSAPQFKKIDLNINTYTGMDLALIWTA